MKNKLCKVSINNETKPEILNTFKSIQGEISFNSVQEVNLRHLEYGFKMDVYFESKLSKNNIYFIMNQIQANPITFLNCKS